MRKRVSRRLVAALVAFGHLLASTLLVLPPTAFAQAGDTEPPRIEFEPVDQGILGDTQVISAGITDDVAVDSVTLHFRLDPDAVYESMPMMALGGTSIYSASVETEGTDAQVLQYYVEARDAAGNRSIRGFAFDPLERRLGETAPPAVADPATAPEPGLSTGRKVLYGVLGILAVGAIAAAAGGGGGSDGPRADDPGGVPVTIIVDPLP